MITGHCDGTAKALERFGVEWSEVEWSGLEWSGVEWSGVKWSRVGRARHRTAWTMQELPQIQEMEMNWT